MLDSPNGYSSALLRDLAGWRETAKDLSLQITRLQREHDDLMRKVLAAEVLLGQTDDTGANPTVRSLIRNLMADGHIRTPKDMRAALVAGGTDPKRIPSTSGAFYTALLKLVSDGELKKDEHSRYWNPAKSHGPTTLEDMMK